MVCSLIGQLVRGVAVLTVVWHVSVSPVTCQQQPGEEYYDFITLTATNPINTESWMEKLVAGKESCYYQYAGEGVTYGSIFRVIEPRGQLDARLTTPSGQVLKKSVRDGFFTNQIIPDAGNGYFELCFSNQGKPIHIHIQIFISLRQNVASRHEELKQYRITALEFSNTLNNISLAAQQTLMLVTAEEQTLFRDATLIYGINKSVQHWSLAICVMEVVIALVTVYFIRGLFIGNEKKTGHRPNLVMSASAYS